MDITPIVKAVFMLAAVIILYVLVPYIKSKTTAEQQAKFNLWVKIAVESAEQIYIGSGRGVEKKEYVIAFLKERGMTIDTNALDAMIEAAVYELKNGIFTV